MENDTVYLYLVQWDQPLDGGQVALDQLSIFENRDEALELARAKAGRLHEIDPLNALDFRDDRCIYQYQPGGHRCMADRNHVNGGIKLAPGNQEVRVSTHHVARLGYPAAQLVVWKQLSPNGPQQTVAAYSAPIEQALAAERRRNDPF